jgi:hypothetical protein
MLTPQQVAEKWARNLQGSTQSIRDGVNGVTVAPTHVAAERLDAYQAGVLAALNSGKTRQAMLNSTLEDWKQKMLTNGINNISQGAANAKPKVTRFQTFWAPVAQQIKDSVKSMPKGGEANAKARSARAIEIAMANKYKSRG